MLRLYLYVTRQIIVTKGLQQKDRRSMDLRTFNRKQYFDSYLNVLRAHYRGNRSAQILLAWPEFQARLTPLLYSIVPVQYPDQYLRYCACTLNRCTRTFTLYQKCHKNSKNYCNNSRMHHYLKSVYSTLVLPKLKLEYKQLF